MPACFAAGQKKATDKGMIITENNVFFCLIFHKAYWKAISKHREAASHFCRLAFCISKCSYPDFIKFEEL